MTLREYINLPIVQDYIILDKYLSMCCEVFTYQGMSLLSFLKDRGMESARYHMEGDTHYNDGDISRAIKSWEKGARMGVRQCAENLVWAYRDFMKCHATIQYWKDYQVSQSFMFDNQDCKHPEAEITACTNNIIHRMMEYQNPKNVIAVFGDDPITTGIGCPVFASNVETNDPMVTSIPLGVEHLNRETIDNFQPERAVNEKLMYVNFSISYPNQKKFSMDRAKAFIAYEDEPWATKVMVEAREDYPITRDEFLQDMYEHKFALCPEGLGISTYRTWEALYFKAIPVVKKSRQMLAFSDLPILFVDDYAGLTQGYLEAQYERMLDQEYAFEKLEFSYWRDLILSKVAE